MASSLEFQPVPRLCRYILAVYEDDIRNPLWAPPGGYRMDPDWVVLRKNYEDTEGRVTPYLVYLDHENEDIVLAVRGLDMGRESDHAILFDNKLGQAPFDGGYVHNGFLRAAGSVFETEHEVLRDLLEKYPGYTLTFAGHSLGAGVVSLLTLVALQNRHLLGNIERKRIRCYAMAPARCMSLNLAVRYADVINSVVLQDDFLPRTTANLEDVFKSLICLPCLLCVMCIKDTCMMEEKMITDPRRLYVPGRIYHIVERKPFRFRREPPVVRTAVPVDGRFEHIILSCNAIPDHAIIWIERESQIALDLMVESDHVMEIPPNQRMERREKIAREHNQEYRQALERAAALDVPHSYVPSPYGTFNDPEAGEQLNTSSSKRSIASSKRRESWGDFVGRLFDTDESGHMVLKK